MHGDALFQMGRFEHALVIYHRGIKLRNKGDTNEEFKVRIQKTTNSINNSLKNIQKKVPYSQTSAPHRYQHRSCLLFWSDIIHFG